MTEDKETFEKEKVAFTLQIENTNTSGKLALAEEIATGHVSWKAMKLYYSSVGGPLFWTTFVLGMLSTKILTCVDSWILGQWAAQYEKQASENVSSGFFLTSYGILLFGEGLLYASSMFMWVFGQIKVSRR